MRVFPASDIAVNSVDESLIQRVQFSHLFPPLFSFTDHGRAEYIKQKQIKFLAFYFPENKFVPLHQSAQKPGIPAWAIINTGAFLPVVSF
ncbi:hypothetical protein BCV50_14595 [Bacillus subtilis]|nr:hypothetical protein BCV50_14595 [Bacillus subtilis]